MVISILSRLQVWTVCVVLFCLYGDDNHHSSQHSILCIPDLYGNVKLGSNVNLIREKAQLIYSHLPYLWFMVSQREENPTRRHAPFVVQSLGVWHHQNICTQSYRHMCTVMWSMRMVGIQGFLPGCIECEGRHYTSADQLAKVIPQRYLMQWGVCTIWFRP